MHITDYEKTQTLVDNDLFLLDGPQGTRTMFARDLGRELLALTPTPDQVRNLNLGELEFIQDSMMDAGDVVLIQTTDKKTSEVNGTYTTNLDQIRYAMLEKPGFQKEMIGIDTSLFRKGFYRQKNLGSVFTDEQKEAIRTQTFKDMFIGDYWEIGGLYYRIADINYWNLVGDNSTGPLTKPHLCILMDDFPIDIYHFFDSEANPPIENRTYLNSYLKKTVLDTIAKPIIESAFGADYILEHPEDFINLRDSNDGAPRGTIIQNTKVDAPSYEMIFGKTPLTWPTSGYDWKQLALLRMNPVYQNHTRASFWLKNDGRNKLRLISFFTGRGLQVSDSSVKYRIRPVFGLTGGDLV